MNALSMILARREEAPRALTAALVEKIVDRASNELILLTERLSFQTRFKNALSATAGLFRYREVEPFALLAGRDAAAQTLRNNLEKAQIILERTRRRVPRFDEKLGLISSIRDFLDGAGDPAILVRIEDLADDEGNAEEQCPVAPASQTRRWTISPSYRRFRCCPERHPGSRRRQLRLWGVNPTF